MRRRLWFVLASAVSAVSPCFAVFADERSNEEHMASVVAKLSPEELELKADMARCLEAAIPGYASPQHADWALLPAIEGCLDQDRDRCLERYQDEFPNIAVMQCASEEQIRWWAIVVDLYSELTHRAACRDIERKNSGFRNVDSAVPGLATAHRHWMEYGLDDCGYLYNYYLEGPARIDTPVLCERDRTAARAALYVIWREGMTECPWPPREP